jgi:2-oxoglutarate dehydrogenase complex dehydrogenase (E1) component-like enzyme
MDLIFIEVLRRFLKVDNISSLKHHYFYIEGRREHFKGNSLDWAIGEALAFGSLLKEGLDTQRLSV